MSALAANRRKDRISPRVVGRLTGLAYLLLTFMAPFAEMYVRSSAYARKDLIAFPSPPFPMVYAMIVPAIAEIGLTLWLLVAGVHPERWREAATMAT